MGPGLKKRKESCSVTGTAAPAPVTAPITADPTLAHHIVAPKQTSKLGRTRGIGVRKLIAQYGGKRIDVYVTQEMRSFCGINATKVAAELGVQIRHSCPIEGFFKSWRHVDSGLKEAIIQAVRDKFRIHEDEDEFTELVDEVINEKANTVYTEWKHEMGKHYRLTNENYEKTKDAHDHPYRHPYKRVNQDKWKYMVDHVFGDDTWKKRSLAGQNNRTLLPYNHTLGSRSIPAAMTIEDKMIVLRDQAAQFGTPLTAEELSKAGLGERKNYVRGFGNGPKPSSYISKSKSELARQGQLQKFQAEMDSIREEHRREKEEDKIRREKEQEEARLREEEHTRRYEEVQRNNEAMQRELDEFRKCMMQFRNCEQGTVGSR